MTQPEPGRARSLVNLAKEAEQRGDAIRSVRFYGDALALLAEETDLPLLADTLRWKGTLHREQGETELAYRCYKQSLVHADTCGSLKAQAAGSKWMGDLAQRPGNFSDSEKV